MSVYENHLEVITKQLVRLELSLGALPPTLVDSIMKWSDPLERLHLGVAGYVGAYSRSWCPGRALTWESCIRIAASLSSMLLRSCEGSVLTVGNVGI